jgi:anti-sigma factor RsiW
VTCRDVCGYLLEQAAGVLSADDAAEFDAHLTACGNCRVFRDQYLGAIALGREALQPSAADVPDDLVHAIIAVAGRGAP